LTDIGVVYLYRFAEGERPVQTFLESYRAHPAGVDHDLHVIFKGFTHRNSLATARALFAGLPINSIELDDAGFDVGSYFAAAKLVPNRRLIFFNTFTELLADDWLKKFDKALSLPGVGLVGATGSWQSNRSLYEQSLRSAWDSVSHPLIYLRRLLHDHSSVNGSRSPPSNRAAGEMTKIEVRQIFPRLSRSLDHLFHFHHYLFQYPRFPNPHVRTNAFMIERSRFLAIRMPPFGTKSNVYKFESGRQSLTRQILEQDLRPVVVGRDGHIYETAGWKSSSTYWIGQQANLLVADNRTRDYSEGSEQIRARLQAYVWEDPSSSAVRGYR
jgi:hypothetical protein